MLKLIYKPNYNKVKHAIVTNNEKTKQPKQISIKG